MYDIDVFLLNHNSIVENESKSENYYSNNCHTLLIKNSDITVHISTSPPQPSKIMFQLYFKLGIIIKLAFFSDR